MLRPISISFEFFPPKSTEGMVQLKEAAASLAKAHPHFFSVTFGAGGSTRDGTIDTVKQLQQHTNARITPHLSCIGDTRERIIELIEYYKTLDVKHIVAIRGDLPSGMDSHVGQFCYASELVALIREISGHHFHIIVAAYPEIHPQAKSALDDILNLKRKYDAGANSAVTQYFFNADAYFYYLDDCSKHGINMPIIPGIMPIVHFNKLAKFSQLCGAEIPRWIYQKLESYGDDHDAVKKFGEEFMSHFCEQLIQGGAPGLHFYTLNKAEASLNILRELKLVEYSEERRVGVRE
jgi:methylenetetrahydrofolate reductase (NADH)